MLAAGVMTSFLAPPFEVAERAYLGDQTFPKELRVGYRSRFHALWKLMTTDPFALYKNSFPSILASFVITTMALGSYDFLYELFHPLVYVAECPNWTVKGTWVNQLRTHVLHDRLLLLVPPGRQLPESH